MQHCLAAQPFYSTSTLTILISSKGLSPLSVLTLSMSWMTSRPEIALPNML
jgi:hypothetical protein